MFIALRGKVRFVCVHKMGRTRGKRASNTSKPDKPPSKRKQREVTEAAISGSRSDDPQPRTMGRNKSRRGSVVTRSRAC